MSDLLVMDPYGFLYAEQPRICMGWSPKRQRLIFNEGFGNWESVPVDIMVNQHMNFVTVDWYYWEWDFDQVHAEELEAAAERELQHDEAMRADREDAEHHQHLLSGHLDTMREGRPHRGLKWGAASLAAIILPFNSQSLLPVQ